MTSMKYFITHPIRFPLRCNAVARGQGHHQEGGRPSQHGCLEDSSSRLLCDGPCERTGFWKHYSYITCCISQVKYTIEALRRISMQEGAMGAKLATDVTWNSTANTKGPYSVTLAMLTQNHWSTWCFGIIFNPIFLIFNLIFITFCYPQSTPRWAAHESCLWPSNGAWKQRG